MSVTEFTVNKFELPSDDGVADGPWPQVSFSIQLGKRLNRRKEVINFNMAAYAGSLASRGLSSEDIAATSVLYKNGRMPGLSGTYNGFVSKSKKRQIRINLNPFSSAARANNTLAHETEHRIQDTEGRLNNWAKARNIVRSILQAESAVAVAYGASAYASNPETSSDLLSGQNGAVLMWAGVVVNTAAVLDYRFSALEREAYKAGHDPVPTLTFSSQYPAL